MPTFHASLRWIVATTGMAQAKLASLTAEAESPEQEELGIALETSRNQPKAVSAKTGPYRQNKLVALLARL